MPDTPIEFIDKVRGANRIEQVMPEWVPDFKRFKMDAKGNLKCLCPFHEDTAPSFTVYPRDQYYRCFGCEGMGDVFDLVQEVKGVCFLGAWVTTVFRGDGPSS
jgi:DNA primase